jgi:hypothetical protein
MDNYALMVYDFSHFTNDVNIGDYIQSIAAKQFLPKIDAYIEREYLDKALDKNYKCIMNGWYMHGKHWPPNDKIIPLFISFHINSQAEKTLLSAKSIDYLKKHEPIGCRDQRTMEILQKNGVKSYFSACLTLTLGKTYFSEEKTNEIIFVDPYIDNNIFIRPTRFIRGKLGLTMEYNGLKKKIKSKFSDILPEYALSDFSIISPNIIRGTKGHDELFAIADALLLRYSKARLVITSKIHCAMPCIAMGTPVIYIHNLNGRIIDDCRLDGLLDLFENIIYVDKKQMSCSANFTNGDIKICEKYKEYMKSLLDTVNKFIAGYPNI